MRSPPHLAAVLAAVLPACSFMVAHATPELHPWTHQVECATQIAPVLDVINVPLLVLAAGALWVASTGSNQTGTGPLVVLSLAPVSGAAAVYGFITNGRCRKRLDRIHARDTPG